jgi:serine-type D-Ala-D-Ala carboxypeptidase/endopeptidase (penicillin-binding protein 4)
MKRVLILMCFLFCSYARSGRDQLIEVQSRLEKLLKGYEETTHVGLEVVSLTSGQNIFRSCNDKLFVPASVIKSIVAAAALDILGLNFRFETTLYAKSAPKDGVIQGDLYLKGTGDPSLTLDDLKKMVFYLKLKGIECIEGNLIVDASEFDATALGPGWMWDEGAEYWNSPMSALTVNHSCVDLWVEPSLNHSVSAQVTLFPRTDYVLLRNFATAKEGKTTLSVKRSWITQENIIEIKGNLSPKSGMMHYRVSIDNPPLYAGSLFKQCLEEAGISFQGNVIQGETPSGAAALAGHRSAPLSELVAFMMKESDNLYANCLFKKIGSKELGLPGTWLKGTRAIVSFLQKKVGMDTTDLAIVDGSGESRYNLISPHQMIQFFSWAYGQFTFAPEWIASFPIAGVDGSLRERMKDPLLRGKVRAKTGVMTGIASLAGFVETKDKEILAFSLFVNGFVKSSPEIKSELEDELVAVLANFSR